MCIRDRVTSWGSAIGQWEPAQITAEFAILEWDITKLTVKPGVYEATLKYKAGNHGVDIDWVALLEDGTEVARDPHHGFSGYDKDNITYRLDLRAVKSGAKYLLRASVRGKGGTDSAGDVLMLVP